MAPPTDSNPAGRPRAAFAAFLASLVLSKLADQILLFLVPLVVFQVTNNVGWSGLAFAAEAFPRFISFPICGALCDRISPVKLMRTSQVCRAVVCVIGAGASQAFGGIAWLIGLSAICGVLTTQGAMAREVILPQAFRDQRFEKVLAYTQTADQSGAVAGPLVAGLFLQFCPWKSVIGVAAAMFLLADLATTVWMRTSVAQVDVPVAVRGAWAATMKTALLHVLYLPGLRRLVILAAGVNLIVGATLASSAAMVTGLYSQSSGYYAALQTAGAITTIVILITIAHTFISLNRMGFMAFLFILAGGMLTAVSPNHWIYATGFLLVIGFDKMFNIYIRTNRQKIIPAKDYGKTTGVIVMLNNLTQPLAGLLIGALSGHMTISGTILLLVLSMAALGGLASLSGAPMGTAGAE